MTDVNEPNSKKNAMPKAEILHQLLSSSSDKIDLADWKHAIEQVNASISGNVRPVDWLQQVLRTAGVRGIQPAQFAWRSFDQRRLPALVQYNDEWYFVQKLMTGQLQLTASNGEISLVTDDALQDSTLLWVRIVQKRRSNTGESAWKSRAAKLVWKEIFREPGWLFNVVIATFLVNIFAVATSVFAMQVYDRVVPTQAYATLTTLVFGMLIIVGLDWFLKTTRARIVDSLSCAVDRRISQYLFDHLLHLQLDIQPRSLGTLAAQVAGLDSVKSFFTSGIVFVLLDMPFALMFIGFIAMIGGAVAWVYVLLLPIALLLGLITMFRLRKIMQEQMIRINERQGLLVDTIRGAESIRATNSGWRFAQEWKDITSSINGYNIVQRAISNTSTVSIGSLSTIAYVSAVVVGVMEIEAGNITMGALIACGIMGGRVIGPVSQFVQHLSNAEKVSQSLRMVDDILKLKRERSDDQNLILPEDLPNSIGVEQVRFAYPESPVNQVNIPKLEFKSGERVLLLGSVGCGKSTLLKMLAGLYRPNEGRVLMGGIDLWEIDPQMVTNNLGYLPQTTHLFKGTLRSNLSLSGREGDSRILKVTQDLGIDAIAASSSQGMDLAISEGGEGLSGGQRQLVALGRVVISQPRIWILDEPTSSLDAESEANVWRVLEENIQPEDILIVATHKPRHAAKLATRVVVMQQGEVVMDGKPETVLSKMMAKSNLGNAHQASNRPKPKGGLDVI